MPFQPGQSGNPGGRPKLDVNVQQLARDASPRALQVLIGHMEHEDGNIALKAASAVLDRAYGKPTQTLAGDRDNPLMPEPMTPERMVELARQLTEAKGRK